jgi:hypothetical protein
MDEVKEKHEHTEECQDEACLFPDGIPTHYDIALVADESYESSTYDGDECEFLVKYIKGHQIFAIRGTEGGKLISGFGFVDVIRDMRLIPYWDDDLGFVHSGFLKGARKIVKNLLPFVSKEVPVIVTGHSLGAAMGLIVANMLKKRGYNVVEYVGFACPRVFVFDKFGRDERDIKFPRTIYRYENDIVTQVPLWFPFGYHHVLPLTGIGTPPKWYHLPSILDHSMDNYLEVLVNDVDEEWNDEGWEITEWDD